MDDEEKGGWDIDEAPDADFYNLTEDHLKELGITSVRFRIRIMRHVKGMACKSEIACLALSQACLREVPYQQ